MKREYSTGIAEVKKFFTGNEVEHTPNFGKKTIFVPLDASEPIKSLEWCDHVYLWANHTYDRWRIVQYLDAIEELREREKVDIRVTVEVPCTEANDIINYRYREYVTYVVSVRIPYVEERKDNIYIKIDDVDFKASNSGVWVVPVKELMRDEVKTSWEAYSSDALL